MAAELPAELTPLTPDDILSSLTIDSPKSRIRIKEKVTRITRYTKDNKTWVYGDLRGTSSLIGFYSPVHNAPKLKMPLSF